MDNASQYYWDHPALAPFRKTAKSGEFLFRRGEKGSTLVIVQLGVVELVGERDGEEHLVGHVHPGEFLGEKALVRDLAHLRVFGAKAATNLQYIELGNQELELISKQQPALMIDMMKQMFFLAAKRLDQFTHLSRVLRPSDNLTRLVHLIRHLCYFNGRKSERGFELRLDPGVLRYYIDLSQFELEECLQHLAEKGIVVPKGDGMVDVTNERALLASVPSLREAIPQLTRI